MKKILFFILLLMISGDLLKAQNLIAVQSGSTSSFYTNLDTAIVYAQNGDYIYLPGGNFTVNVIINKCIHLIGAGHHPDSSNITSRTTISGYSQIVLDSGANNGSISGIYFVLSYYDGYPNIRTIGNLKDYTISRCYISKSIIIGQSSNLIIKENIISDINIAGTNNIISNNIILGVLSTGTSTIKNNLFTFSSPGYSQYGFFCSDCLVENNIYKPNIAPLNYGGNNIFHNNLNAGVNGIYSYYSTTNQGSNNYLDNIDIQSIFINYNANTIGGDGIYNTNFHLPTNSPYKNAGTDGTDIGIYGGMFPWKDGSLPPNPHIQQKIIQQSTDANGSLNVKIKVAAQER